MLLVRWMYASGTPFEILENMKRSGASDDKLAKLLITEKENTLYIWDKRSIADVLNELLETWANQRKTRKHVKGYLGLKEIPDEVCVNG